MNHELNQPSKARRVIRWLLTSALFVVGIVGTLLFGYPLIRLFPLETSTPQRFADWAEFCAEMAVLVALSIACLVWAILRIRRHAAENNIQTAATYRAATSPQDKPQPGSLGLLIISVFYLMATAGPVALLISKIYRHRTNPEFAGESFDQADIGIILAMWALGLLVLITNFVPALILRLRHNRRRDRLSLKLSVISLIMLASVFASVLFGIGR